MAPRALEPKRLGPWARGVNNVRRPTNLHRNELLASVNLDLTAEGDPRRRRGRNKVYSGTNVHSLWKSSRYTFVVDDSKLKLFNADHTTTEIVTLVDGLTQMSYEEVNGDVYYMNGTDSGKIKGGSLALRPLGLPTPDASAIATAATGVVPTGTYTIAFAFVAPDGDISALSAEITLEISAENGILLQNIPQPPAGYTADTMVYMSEPDGTELYFINAITQGTTSFAYTAEPKRLVIAETQYMDQLPAGNIVREYNGRLYVAKGKVLYMSEPLRFGLYKPEDSYLVFDEDIKVMEPTEDGIYVVSNETVFLQGKDLLDMEAIPIDDNSATAGSGMQAPGHWFKTRTPLPDKVGFWYSSRGSVIGAKGGDVIRIMEGHAEDAEYAEGSSFLAEHNGLRQIGTVLKGRDNESGLRMTESYTAVVRNRNGVVISSE